MDTKTTYTLTNELLEKTSKTMSEEDFTLFSLLLCGHTENDTKAKFFEDAKNRGLL